MYRQLHSWHVHDHNIFFCLRSDSVANFHNHDFIELVYVLNGRAKHTLGDVTQVISKGDYLIVDYGVYHRYEQIGNTPFQVLNCMFAPKLFDETLYNHYRLEEIADNHLVNLPFHMLKDHPTKFIYHDSDGHVRKILEYLYEEYEKKDISYQEMIRCHLIAILIEMMRQVKRPNPEDTENSIVKHIVKYVQKHFMEKISLEDISQKYNYSLSYISQIFKFETGFTFREYLQSVRIQESCRLLVNTNKKVTEISEIVGYTDVNFFNQIFKRHTGLTPRQFKKAYNEKTPNPTN